ncbi:hypothetical protein [Paenibacillus shenyangensis]|uniref:hypothetical protein n=1 Tax=Paenibacillus sp. A9 TaxID=1284352 RepID=UPI0012690D40|nr:hypothetical protein [Paenibacillus sp. A9]
MFGDCNIFSVKYEFTMNRFNEKGLLADTWGMFELWVNGKELCRFSKNDQEQTYEWNLIHVVEWMCENLPSILHEEEFPLPVKGNTTLELLTSSLDFDSENDDEFDEWFGTKQGWEFKHSWFSSRGGSYLPEIYFRRDGSQIEISWNNEGLYNNGISFLFMTGVEYVPIQVFESVLKNFIQDFRQMLRLKTEYTDEYEKFSEKVLKKQ